MILKCFVHLIHKYVILRVDKTPKKLRTCIKVFTNLYIFLKLWLCIIKNSFVFNIPKEKIYQILIKLKIKTHW